MQRNMFLNSLEGHNANATPVCEPDGGTEDQEEEFGGF